jgi:hypothetical protein
LWLWSDEEQKIGSWRRNIQIQRQLWEARHDLTPTLAGFQGESRIPSAEGDGNEGTMLGIVVVNAELDEVYSIVDNTDAILKWDDSEHEWNVWDVVIMAVQRHSVYVHV